MDRLRWSPDGKLLVGAGQDTAVRRWDVSAPAAVELPVLAGHNGWVSAIVFHDDGRLFTADSWGAVRCWPAADRDAKPAWTGEAVLDGWIHDLALSPDGKTLAAAGNDGRVRLISAVDGKPVRDLVGHTSDVFSVAFHPDGKVLVSGDHFGVIKQWDLATGKPTREFDASNMHKLDRLQNTGGVRCLIFDGPGTLVAAGTDNPSGGFVQGTPVLMAFDFKTGKTLQSLKLGKEADGFFLDVQRHGGGFLALAGSGQPGQGKFLLHRVGEPAPFFTVAKPNCHSVALSPDGTRAAVASAASNGGNGRALDKNGEYVGGFSNVLMFDLLPAKKI